MTDLRMKDSSRSLMLAALTCYLLLVAVMFVKIRANNDGHFFYALDDPYIHLALSEQLAHGHYGLNPGEATSPSSSIVWPFLLIPFAGHPLHLYMPLLWNVLFGSLAMWVIAGTVSRLPGFDGDSDRMAWGKRLGIALLLMLAGIS
jgi:hypothetical protein